MSQMIPEELEEFVTITIPQEDGTEQEFAIVDSFNAAATISLFPV